MSGEWLDRGLIYSPCYLMLCKTEKEFKKALNHLKVKQKDRPEYVLTAHSAATVHFFRRKNKLTALVCIKDYEKRTPSEVVGLLIHEAVHVWQEIKENIGEHKPSPEFEAYSIQSISQNLIESYSK